MKLVKLLGLAAVASIAAMAFLGAATASATQLCSTDPEGSACKAGTALSGTLNIDGQQLGTGILKTSLGNIECTGSSIKGTTATGPSASLLGTIAAFIWSGCTSHVFLCEGGATVTTTAKPEFHITYTEPGLGLIVILKPSTTVTMPCGIKCKFAENDSVDGLIHNLFEGKVLPVALFKEAPITGPGGGLCPSSGKESVTVDLSYLLTEGGVQDPLFIAEK